MSDDRPDGFEMINLDTNGPSSVDWTGLLWATALGLIVFSPYLLSGMLCDSL